MTAEQVLVHVYDSFENAEDKDGENLLVTGVTSIRYKRKEITEANYVLVACKKTGKIFKLLCVEVNEKNLTEDEKLDYITAMKYVHEDINGPWRNY